MLVLNGTGFQKRCKLDRVSTKGFNPRSCKRRTVYINSPKRQSIIIVSIQNIFPHLADTHLKINIRTQRRQKQLEGYAVVRRNKKRT